MFLESIISGKRNLFWIIFHLFLGLLSTISPFTLIIWFYIILFANFNNAIVQLRKGKAFNYIALMTYLMSFEMLGRMAKSYPFIPMELSKYGLIIFFIIGIGNSVVKINKSWVLLIISISISLFIDYSKQRQFFDIINNYFGLLAMNLGIVFLTYNKFSLEEINNLMYLILLCLISSLIYTFIKTPNFEDIEFTISANFETSGGAATNQVSTVFGFGLFLSFYFWYKRIKLSGYRNFDLIIGIGFLAQGLLTFSRGGIIVSIIVILYLILISSTNFNFRNLFFAFLGILLLVITFNFINEMTGGKLLLRYQGETEGTYYHGAEKDLNKITSSRSVIFGEDLKLWYDNPIFGVGVGVSKYIRGGFDQSVASHIEFSRLLAEHGLFGLVFFIAILNLGFKLWNNARITQSRQILFILFLIGFMTSFHSAMRTFVTPLLISLSSIGLYSVRKNSA
jgi:hypothetical protein